MDWTGDVNQIRVSAIPKTTGARWTDDGWVEPDSFAPNTVEPKGRKRRAGGRSAMKRIPDGTVLRRDNQWGIPRKRALFVSDGPDSTTSGSDILEGHYDRPPEEEYSDIPNSGQPHDWYVAEELCSPSRQLEKAVVRLQQDITAQITARSSNSIGHRLRRSLLGGLYSASEAVGVYVDVSS